MIEKIHVKKGEKINGEAWVHSRMRTGFQANFKIWIHMSIENYADPKQCFRKL